MDPMELDHQQAADSEATDDDYDDAETEDEAAGGGGEEEEDYQPASAPRSGGRHRSRGTSPSASARSDSAAAGTDGDDVLNRLTARQRARLDKESGMAQDVVWSQMELLPKLSYTYRGKGTKKAGQMTEEEWLKHQEALERRRVRSLRDKREAEEAVKAKIRRAVTARMRGKLGGAAGGDSGLEGGGDGGAEQEAASLKPGWVRMRYTADGVTVAWHAAAHPLSLPVPVVAPPDTPLDPIDLPLQMLPDPAAGQSDSSSAISLGSVLSLLPAAAGGTSSGDTGEQAGLQLRCVDSQGSTVGCLAQQAVLDAMELAGVSGAGGDSGAAPQHLDWQHWRAVVRSVRRGGVNGALVRLVPAQQLEAGDPV